MLHRRHGLGTEKNSVRHDRTGWLCIRNLFQKRYGAYDCCQVCLPRTVEQKCIRYQGRGFSRNRAQKEREVDHE